jgi:hypothetical protein
MLKKNIVMEASGVAYFTMQYSSVSRDVSCPIFGLVLQKYVSTIYRYSEGNVM